MADPLPAMPAGGHYVIEVTSGFVNNWFINNQINLAGKSSTGIVLNGADFGSTITGNLFAGGSSGSPVYTQTAILDTSVIGSAASGNGPFPLPQGWTALPNLGTVIAGNTIRDFLGGIVIGVQHYLNYWQAQVLSSSETGRVFVTAQVSGNTFEYDASFLAAWASSYASYGNNPAQTSTPPSVTIGSGWSAQAPGPYGNPRFPWTREGADTVNGANSPIFIDPAENVVSVAANLVEQISSAGAATPMSGATSQVYAGTVNGSVIAPVLAGQSYQKGPYYAFNLTNLDISGGSSTTPPPPPPPPPGPPGAVAPPTGVVARQAGANQIEISWTAAPGAAYYTVERGLGGSWGVAASIVTTTFYLDTGLAYATTYSYCVVAVAPGGASALSSVVSATTGSQSDVLSAQVSALSLRRGVVFAGPIASFTDTSPTTSRSQFVARINWGDGRFSQGTVSGGGGSFTVSASHAYAKNGRYTVSITVTLAGPGSAGATGSGTVVVINPPRHHPRARLIHRQTKKPPHKAKGHRK
jgi:hypothetical protein